MKKIISALSLFSMFILLSFNAFALIDTASPETHTTIKYFEDGSYIETIITEENTCFSTFATTTKRGSKKLTYKNDQDEIQWTATITGIFTYTGSNSTCTSSSITYSITNTKWKITSATASKSYNKATGNVTAKRYALGIPVQTVEETITLTCSATGVLS